MEKKELKQELKFKLLPDVITGFSYSFSRILLEKLKELKKEDRIFEGGEEAAKQDEAEVKGKGLRRSSDLTEVSVVIVRYLSEQMEFNRLSGTNDAEPIEIDELINVAEEFLTIFEEKTVSVEEVRKYLESVIEFAKGDNYDAEEKLDGVIGRLESWLSWQRTK